MRIELVDMDELCKLNHLQEVTSYILLTKGDIPHPQGLVSNEIFGVTVKERKNTFAYIDLHGHYFNPHVFKLIRRLYRNIDKVVNGELYITLDNKGHIIPSTPEEGSTGIDWLYDNWEKIKWERSGSSDGSSMRDERIEVLEKNPKNKLFISKQIVIPPFYRDVKTLNRGGGEIEDINNMYSRLIRYTDSINNKGMFGFQFHNTNYNIQTTIVEIYDYFEGKIQKKQGLIRKYLMGKSVDFGSRTVITSTNFHAETPEDMFIDFNHAAIPISQICATLYPFVRRYVQLFIERNILDKEHAKTVYIPDTDELATIPTEQINNPSSIYNDKFIDRMIEQFQKDPECRFNTFDIPVVGKDKPMKLAFTGTRVDPTTRAEIPGIAKRPMTWTDLLFLAACDSSKGKHANVSRYPLLDEFGIFFAHIRVSSTVTTVPMVINGQLYRWYPDIDLSTPKRDIGTKFIDSLAFSSGYLPGLDGDLKLG